MKVFERIAIALEEIAKELHRIRRLKEAAKMDVQLNFTNEEEFVKEFKDKIIVAGIKEAEN